MILDSEAQRQVLLGALMNVPIQGDYAGLMQQLPQLTAVVEAVKAATIEVSDASKPE